MNLSSETLSEAQISVLDKGLTFIPSTRFIPYTRLLECKNRNIRSIKLRDYFYKKPQRNYNPNAFQNLFKPQSTFIPTTDKLSPEAIKAVQAISDYTARMIKGRLVKNGNPSLGPLVRLPPMRPNITKAEARAITELKSNKSIVIKPADKGGAVVVMNRNLYEQEGLRQLTNPKYYTEIPETVCTDTVERINEILTHLNNIGFINDDQYSYLFALVPAEPRSFYLLPKVHKDKAKWPNPQMPEGRPIVADCGSETERICKFIDFFLKPLSNYHPSYIKDTYHFVAKIRGQKIPDNAFLVTGDVTALYTNMDIDITLTIIKEAFESVPDRGLPNDAILHLLELTLRRNDFQFAGRIFLQLCGTAMGKDYAPSLANIFLQTFDRHAMEDYGEFSRLYSRFLDDIFLIWCGTRQKLKEYGDYLNTLIPGIKVTLSVKSTITEFLDTLVYKNLLEPGWCELRTRVYFKPTDTHQLLYGSSFHPRHCTRGILKSQILRFKRISTTKADFLDACNELFAVLKNRGYGRALYRRTRKDIWRTDQDQQKLVAALAQLNAGVDDKQVWPLINYYDPISIKIAHRTRSIVSELACAKDKRLINAYRIHDNLKSKLVRSRFSGAQPPSKDNAN